VDDYLVSLKSRGTARFEFVSLDGNGRLSFVGSDYMAKDHRLQRDRIVELAD
jgi:hypothetical protein